VELDREGNQANESSASSPSSSSVPVESGTSFLRRLSDEEVKTLKDFSGCSCTNDDWSTIYLLLPASTTNEATTPQNEPVYDFGHVLRPLVSNTHFDGFVVLDLTTPSKADSETISNANNEWSRIPPGLHSNACVSDSIIRIKSSRVYRNSLVSRTFVGSDAVLMNCGRIFSTNNENDDSCGKLNITVGAESGGGRSLLLTTESTMIGVCKQLTTKCDTSNDDIQPSISNFPFNVLSNGSVVCDTPKVHDVFLYPSSFIEAACSVHSATLLDRAKISSGSIVSNVIMQWDACISGNSTVSNTFLMEHAHLGPSSIVESIVLGPDSHASAGEIHASVIGPNTNAHHQSLVIGMLWPLGRGNVAYGANVGSNHTGRLPDQECSAGEGIFWGLGCVAKFPLDLSSASYSMVAAGTKLSPQRITMPFSLIVESSSEQKSNSNDIVPGWVLQHSPYTLARNEKKFATRRKAKNHAFYSGWKILRPSTIEGCKRAREILRQSVSLRDVPGIGQCQLTERGRTGGIKAYDNCIQLYALRGLLAWLEGEFAKHSGDNDVASYDGSAFSISEQTDASFSNKDPAVEWPSFPWESNGENSSVQQQHEWKYQQRLLLEEFPVTNSESIGDLSWIQRLLDHLLFLEKDFCQRIAKCKQRDDTRGAAVVPGYSDSHVMAENDPVVVDAKEQLKATETKINMIIAKIRK